MSLNSFKGRVVHGEIVPITKAGRPIIENYEGKEVTVTVKKFRKSRSLSQNAYWYGVVGATALKAFTEMGIDILDEYEALYHLKIRVFYRTILVDGTPIRVPRETSKLTTVEFVQLIDRVAIYLAENYKTELPMPFRPDTEDYY